MSLEISLLKEGFPAVLDGALVVSFAIMLVEVHSKALIAGIRLKASRVVTGEFPDFQVNFGVILEMALRVECFIASCEFTHERFVNFVIALVGYQQLDLLEGFSALIEKTFVLVSVDFVLEDVSFLKHFGHLLNILQYERVIFLLHLPHRKSVGLFCRRGI